MVIPLPASDTKTPAHDKRLSVHIYDFVPAKNHHIADFRFPDSYSNTLMRNICIKYLFTSLITVFIWFSALAQAPQKMSYQAVIRNSSNQPVANQAVGMQISILQGSATGTTVYVETQNPVTNAAGLASVEIGGGTVVNGTFAGINWANGTYFIKTETDPAGGTNYTITGISQLLSVPYALSAGTSRSAALADTLKSGLDANSKYALLHNGTGWVAKSPANADVTLRVNSGLQVDGNTTIPGNKEYRYLTDKTKTYLVGAADMQTVNPTVYQGQINRLYSTGNNINGPGSLWAVGGTAGQPAYFVAPLHLPDSAIVTNITALAYAASGTSAARVSLLRSSVSYPDTQNESAILYFLGSANTPIVVESNTAVPIDNSRYIYTLRFTGEQNVDTTRFAWAIVTYTVKKAD